MRTLQTLALAVVVLAALAGCSGKGRLSEDQKKDLDEYQATATTGVIRGVVVDAAIRPLTGVLLTTVSAGKTLATNSSATGAFGFKDLAPGTYLVKAHKLGYTDVQASVEVKANDNAPAVTRISMEANPSTKPFVEPYLFKGFIECSFTAVAVSFAACSAPNGLTCDIDPAVPCSGNVTNDNFLVTYHPQRPPTWLQSEMVWDSTQALGSDLTLMYSYTCPENDPLYCDHLIRGASPLLLVANATAIHKIGADNGTDIIIRVFNTYSESTAPPPGTCAPNELPAPAGGRCVRGIGATLEQEIKIYTHIFYGFAPPEGYRFTKDSDPVVPT